MATVSNEAELFILEDSLSEKDLSLVRGLRSLGFTTRFVSLSKVLPRPRGKSNPILVALLDGDDEFVKQRITEINENKSFAELALLVSADGAGNLTESLFSNVHFFHTVDLVSSSEEIAEALSLLQRKIDARRDTAAVKKKFVDVFKGNNKFSELREIPLGGKLFAIAKDPSVLQQENYIPPSDEIELVLEIIGEEASPWLLGHIHRTAFVAFNIRKALGTEEVLEEVAQVASLLFNWTLLEDEVLCRKSLIDSFTERDKKTYREKLEECGSLIVGQLNMPEAGEIVAAIAPTVEGYLAEPKDEVAFLGAVIYAADCLDRACWGSGFWDSSAAYRFLNKVKAGKIENLDPAISSSLLKIILEGISVGSEDDQPYGAEEQIKSGTRSVPIFSLAPGMRLASPLTSLEGKVLLDKTVVLDADLIWKIWSLSAVGSVHKALLIDSDTIPEG